MLLPVIVALELMFPATSSLYCGLDVPMPTLPLESRRMRSPQALPLKVQNARLLAGPLEPLMISPVWEELSYPRWMPLLFVGSINAPRLYQFPIIEAPGLLSVKGFVGFAVPMPTLPPFGLRDRFLKPTPVCTDWITPISSPVSSYPMVTLLPLTLPNAPA